MHTLTLCNINLTSCRCSLLLIKLANISASHSVNGLSDKFKIIMFAMFYNMQRKLVIFMILGTLSPYQIMSM